MGIVTKYNKLHDRYYGDWRTKDISPTHIPNLRFGAHILYAKAFGLKGSLGGRHSWLVYSEPEKHHVFEITDQETLELQASEYKMHTRHKGSIMGVFQSNREPTQKWFGNNPRFLTSIPGLTLADCVRLAETYPLANRRYDLVRANCNTFISWVAYVTSTKISLRHWQPGMYTQLFWKQHAI